MAVPTYDEITLPLLQFAADNQSHNKQEALAAIADFFRLSEEERTELIPSGKQTRFDNRLTWAKTHLTKAGLLESTGWGQFRITGRGLQVLAGNPSRLDTNFLMQFPEFAAFFKPNLSKYESDVTLPEISAERTPEEVIFTTHQQLQSTLVNDLLEKVLAQTPQFFEELVVDLFLAMGYGGSLDSGRSIGQSGDGGIDGYIQEDKLGLDIIYLQAKKWGVSNTVGRPAVQSFVGSLVGLGAKKGVFITTSDFSSGALDYARGVKDLKIILINGEQLAKLMIEHGVGVSVKTTYIIKQIDENYFPEV